MNSTALKLKICPIWYDHLASMAVKNKTTISQIVRESLQKQLSLPVDTMQHTYRNTTSATLTKARRPKRAITRVTISCDLPRWMDAVIKYAAKQKGWSISTLVCVILHSKYKDSATPLPSKPPVTAFNEGMVKRIPLEDAPDKYHLRASVPKDWEPILIESALDQDIRLSELLRDAVMESLQGLKEIAQQS